MGETAANHQIEVIAPSLDNGSGERGLVESELNLTSQVTGQVDTLRNTILSYVANNRWDYAIRELALYRKTKAQKEPSYEPATEKLFKHCSETIEMIKFLLTSQDISILPVAKRYDVYNKVKRLFENTKQILLRLEQIENDLLVKDARSVTWFLRSIIVCAFVVVALAAAAEAVVLAGKPLEVIAEEGATLVFSLIGL